jgi:hypothetical protein
VAKPKNHGCGRGAELPFDIADEVGAVEDEPRMLNLADLRKDYRLAGLHERDLARDPCRQPDQWFRMDEMIWPSERPHCCHEPDGARFIERLSP